MRRTSPPRPVLITVVAALVVAVAAQVAATLVTPDPPAGSEQSRDEAACGGQRCRVLASTMVNGMLVELLTDQAGTTGTLRAGGAASEAIATTRLPARGVRLTHNSLRCSASPTPVCLVRGHNHEGMVGELHLWRGNAWERPRETFVSGAGMVVLDDVLADRMPEIVLVRHHCGAEVPDGPDGESGESGDGGSSGSPGSDTDNDTENDTEGHTEGGAEDGTSGAAGSGLDTVDGAAAGGDCASAPVLAEVLDLRGERAGCTQARRRPEQLRGWPEVDLRGSELRPCPARTHFR